MAGSHDGKGLGGKELTAVGDVVPRTVATAVAGTGDGPAPEGGHRQSAKARKARSGASAMRATRGSAALE